ncbi:hypothetical protein [Trichloromonas sp.]|uniref:LVIVD repeat-containing protein n=1 Tax=Trichloromonas sp. TaxID=3069249 RepID=UPI002A3F8DC6|nr:hypothetical protein [Trichloromonas sp.]
MKRRKTLLIFTTLTVYFGLIVALALPLLGEHQPPEDLRLDALDRRQGTVGQSLFLRLKGAGFDANTRFALIHDSGNQQAISRRIATFAGVRTLLRDGSDLYLGTEDRRIWKIDLNRPESPQQRNAWNTSGLPTSSLKAGDSLWVASGQGDLIRINPNGESRNRIASSLMSLAQGPDNTLLAAAGPQGLLVLRPRAGTAVPHLIATLELADAALAVSSRGHLALLGAAKTGLHICDLSDPAAPRLLARIPLTGIPRHIAIQDALALIATSEGLSLVDIGDPGAPVLLSELPLGSVHQILVRGDRAYLAAGASGLLQVELRDPHRPQVSGHLTPGDAISCFILDDERAILGTASAELLFADLAGIGKHPQWRPQFSHWRFPIDQAPGVPPLAAAELADSLARIPDEASMSVNMLAYDAATFYLATDQGLKILPRDGTTSSRVPEQRLTSAGKLALSHMLLLVAGSLPAPTTEGDPPTSAPHRYGVEIFLLDESGEPRPLALISTPEAVTQMQVKDNLLYLTSVGQGGRIFDLQDARHPRPLGCFQLPWPEQAFANSQEFALNDEILYLANGRAGLQVFDIADPSSPRRIGSLNPPGGQLIKIGRRGDQLFVYDQKSDLRLYDISAPHAPRLVGVLDRISALQRVEVQEQKLLLVPARAATIKRALPLAAEKVDLKSSTQAEISFPPPVFPGDYFLYAFDVQGHKVHAGPIRIEKPQK